MWLLRTRQMSQISTGTLCMKPSKSMTTWSSWKSWCVEARAAYGPHASLQLHCSSCSCMEPAIGRLDTSTVQSGRLDMLAVQLQQKAM